MAEIGGIDISRPVEPTGMAALWDASDAHAVLVFRGQTLPQRSVVLRAVRARGDRRAHPRQDRPLEKKGGRRGNGCGVPFRDAPRTTLITGPDPRLQREKAILDERARYASLMENRPPTPEEIAWHTRKIDEIITGRP